MTATSDIPTAAGNLTKIVQPTPSITFAENEIWSDMDEPETETESETYSDDGDSESDSTTGEDYKADYVLSQGKPPEKQMKFVVFEEAVIQAFLKCKQCGTKCTVALKHHTGSHCVISVSCEANAAHNLLWSTGPISNNLPIFNLLLATVVFCTGMESTKVLRLFSALNIPSIKYRQLSSLTKFYVIPGVYAVWRREQSSQLEEIKGKSITVASDMRVDSPGHSGLFGAGSTLEMNRNIVLDTQIIKVK
jgi:hypothetical protein